jgi:hypothetical protein
MVAFNILLELPASSKVSITKQQSPAPEIHPTNWQTKIMQFVSG